MAILPAGTYYVGGNVVVEQDITFNSNYTGGNGFTNGNPDQTIGLYFSGVKACNFPYSGNSRYYMFCSDSTPLGMSYNSPFAGRSFTYDGKTVYYHTGINIGPFSPEPTQSNYAPSDIGTYFTGSAIAWLFVYSDAVIPDGYNVTYDLVNCTGEPDNPVVITPSAVITNAYFTPDDTNGTFDFNSGSVWIDGTGIDGNPVLFVWEPETGHLKIGPVTSDITVHVHAYGDPYQDVDGEDDIPGGGSVGVPGFPALSATSTGIIGLFAPSASQMQALASFMWTDFGGAGTTTEDILKEIVEALKRSISNPLDYVVGLNIIPSQGLSIGASQTIRFGFVSSNVSMPALSSQYFTVDCGSITFNPLCGDTFLDYAPYSKFSIYLPYIGVKDLDANDCVGHTIGVVYHGDTVTGGVTAYITKDGSVMYQYSGCCALNVPLSSDNWGSTIAGAVQIATSMVSGGLTAGAAGVGAAAAQGAANVAANPSLLSPQVQHSGAVSGGAGCMGVQYPFIIREAVRFHSTAGFNTISGYPSFYKRKLQNVHGYTTVVDVHLSKVPATKPEIDEIIDLLKGGVYL